MICKGNEKMSMSFIRFENIRKVKYSKIKQKVYKVHISIGFTITETRNKYIFEI